MPHSPAAICSYRNGPPVCGRSCGDRCLGSFRKRPLGPHSSFRNFASVAEIASRIYWITRTYHQIGFEWQKPCGRRSRERSDRSDPRVPKCRPCCPQKPCRNFHRSFSLQPQCFTTPISPARQLPPLPFGREQLLMAFNTLLSTLIEMHFVSAGREVRLTCRWRNRCRDQRSFKRRFEHCSRWAL